MVIDSADEALERDTMDTNEQAIYDLLVQLEAMGWDGVSGLTP